MAEVISKNQSVIDSSVQALANKEDPNLVTALQRISKDLKSIYNTLFAGPLPAVSGFELTSINAAVISGIISRANLPEEIAYEDEVNAFSEENDFDAITNFNDDIKLIADDGYAWFGWTSPTQYLRIGSGANRDYIIGQNIRKVAGSWTNDEARNGCALELFDGEIFLVYRNNGAGTTKTTFKFSDKEFLFRNAGDTVFKSIIAPDANDVIQLAKDFQSDGKYHIAIPDTAAANLPAASGNLDGLIAIDTTNNRLCFYAGGARYYVTGTSF